MWGLEGRNTHTCKATRKAGALRVLCVCPSSNPCAERGHHCAEPTTTRTLAGQLRLRGPEMRHCCLPSDVRLHRALEKERPVPEELHAHIQQALVSSVNQSAGVYRWARREGYTNTVVRAQHLWICTATGRCTPSHAQRQVVHGKILEQSNF